MSMADLGSMGSMGAAGTASTAISGAGAVANMFSSFRGLGVAMRFSVVIGQRNSQYDLGSWTSCEGLRVEFKFDEIRSGGDYGSTHALPTYVSYNPVTLKRAVEFDKSKAVQTWLRDVATKWSAGDGTPYQGTSVVITLHDVMSRVASQWVLSNAYPTSWSGPSLGAKSGDVATETLVFSHNGFLG